MKRTLDDKYGLNEEGAKQYQKERGMSADEYWGVDDSPASSGGSLVGSNRNPDYGGNGDVEIAKRTAVPDPSAIRENNQRKISQVSPYMDDPVIGGVTKDASAPSSMSPDGTQNIMFFGSKARQVDQRTGKETWFDVDAQGNLTERKEAPASERVAQDGGVWSKLAGNRESDLWRQRNLMELQSKKRQLQMKAAPKVEMGNLMRMAHEGLGSEYAEVVKGKDGNSYKVYKVSDDAVSGVNSMLMKNGVRNSVKGVTASVMVDKDGNPVGKVRFDILRQRDGNINDKGEVLHDSRTIEQAQDLFVRGLIDSGTIAGRPAEVESIARNRAVEAFGGSNASDWAAGRNNLANRATEAKVGELEASAKLHEAQAKAGGFRPGADYSGKNVASIISSVLKNDTDGSMKKMMQENPEAFYDMVMKAAGGEVGNGGGDATKGGNNGGSGTTTSADTLGERLKAAELKKKGIGGIVSAKNGDASASSLPAAGNASSQDESKSDFDKENERLVSEFKKYGGTVNEDGSFKLGHTDVLPAGDTTDISDRPGISQELVDFQKSLFDDKSLFDESAKAEENRIRTKLSRKYAGNKKGLDKEVKKWMSAWREDQFKKTRNGSKIHKMPAFAH